MSKEKTKVYIVNILVVFALGVCTVLATSCLLELIFFIVDKVKN